jgi:prolyl 3-hydroxylase /prolyl 3,4-dihydroxylase
VLGFSLAPFRAISDTRARAPPHNPWTLQAPTQTIPPATDAPSAKRARDQAEERDASDAAAARRKPPPADADAAAADNAPAPPPRLIPPSVQAALASGGGELAATAVFRPDLLTDASKQQAARTFASNQPFPHLVLRDLVADGGALLRAVREELVTHVRATYKETDLFRVFQTGDLAALDALDEEQRAKLPALRALRAALYSESFRAFVRGVTGCGELDGTKTDLSCNVYAPGGHLLCHDDVIGSRRVSFIVYLTDPDDPWDAAADGGALELYPLGGGGGGAGEGGPGAGAAEGAAAEGGGDTGTLPPPSVVPSTLLPPYWNSMAMFVVTPGVSYHSVQEVTAPEGKARLSISGWYHAPAPPPGAETVASLAQLRLAPGADAVRDHETFVEEDAEGEGRGLKGAKGDKKEEEKKKKAQEAAAAAEAAATARDPSARDLELLARFVAPAYLDPKAWEAVRRKFEVDGSVQLYGFLRPEVARRITRAARRADARDGLGGGRPLPRDYRVGAGGGGGGSGGWQAVGPPHKQRYLRFGGEAAPVEALLTPEEEEQKEKQKEVNGDAGQEDPGALMAALRRDVFSTAAFARLLRRFTSVQMLGYSGEVRRFRPGLDYTVAHYGVLTSDPRLDCVLCFVDDGKDLQQQQQQQQQQEAAAAGPSSSSGVGAPAATAAATAAAEAWADGEVGGYEAYVLGDDDDDDDDDDEDDGGAGDGEEGGEKDGHKKKPEKAGGGGKKGGKKGAAEVYRADDGDAGVLNVPAASNCLSLLLRDEGLMRFVKYVSAAAPGSRWDVAMEYLPDEGSSSEEGA